MKLNDKNITNLVDDLDAQNADILIDNVNNFDNNDASNIISKNRKMEILIDVIEKNKLGCDFLLCLFIAAVKSYRADRCVRPFPKKYVNSDNEKDFQLLRNVCDTVPSIKAILKNPHHLTNDIQNLLTWLFIVQGSPVLKYSNYNNLPENVRKKIEPKPQHIFEVCYPEKVENTWNQRKGNQSLFYAYHGSSTDNFYSILKVGLQQHFSIEKEVLFGNGIYLSNELSVCTHYAPFQETWKNSALGSKHSVIAVCEVIDDIEKVKCKDANNKERSMTKSIFGDIPEEYIVVRDSDMVRVRYLLVYEAKNVPTVTSFIKNNILWISMILYFIMLAFIGFMNGPTWQKLLKYFK